MKKIMKRLIAIICVAVMLGGLIPTDNLEQVNATEVTETTETTEKTVEVQRLEEGTVTPGTVTDEDGTVKYSKEGYIFGGYYNRYDESKEPEEQFSSPLTETRTATSEEPVFIRWVPEEVMNVKAQVRYDDCEDYKKVISNCDGIADDSNDYNIDKNAKAGTPYTADGYVQEGYASLGRVANINSAAVFNLNLKDVVDVTGYKYFSCKLYISDASALGKDSDNNCLNIVLSSAGATNKSGALCFYVTYDELQDYQMEDETGWYELILPFAQADYINVASSASVATYNGAAINFVQIRQGAAVSGSTDTVTMCIDDICVLNDNPGVVLVDGDQLTAPNFTASGSDHDFTYIKSPGKGGTGSNTLETGESGNFKEGTGAVKASAYTHTNAQDTRMGTYIYMSAANTLDISDYAETGSLHLWLYIGNVSYLSSAVEIKLASDGTGSTKYVIYEVETTSLDTGWNEIICPLNDPDTDKSIAWEAVNCIQVSTTNMDTTAEDYDESLAYMIVDDIRVVDTMQVAACDSADESTNTKYGVTVKKDDVKEGKGAFVNEDNTGKVQHLLRFDDNPINFESIPDGCLHFWYYIEEPSYLGADEVWVELSSVTTDSDKQDCEYSIAKESLTKGWNEIYIYLTTPTAVHKTNGEVDWSSIQHFRIYCKSEFTELCTTKIDDISLVSKNKETVDVRFVSTVESLGYQKVGYKITPSRGTENLTTLTTEATDVYEELFAMNNNGKTDGILASEVSGLSWSKYMHAATVTNIPNRLWDATFTIVPYWVTQDGTEVMGKPRTLTINYLLSVTKQEKVQTDFRVVITSDPHYTEKYYVEKSRDYGYSADQRMQLWVDTILAEHARQPIDLIIVNGDVSLDYWDSSNNWFYTDNETKIFVDEYVSQLREEEIPVIVLPGNHEPYSEEDWYQMTGNSRTETYVLGNNLFIMPDSFGNNLDPSWRASEGEYSAFDVEAIQKQMAEYPSHKVYIISHHINMAEQDSEFLELLKSNSNIMGLFSGHTHTARNLTGATYGGKVLAETGNFSYVDADDKENNFWGFRDLVITEYHASSRYITAECDPTVNGEQVHYDRKEINEVSYY